MTDAAAPSRIERRKVYDLVAERLMTRFGADLPVGSPLPSERELSEDFGVGRSSVREALRMLESRGLIESRGNGAFVVASWRNPLNHSLAILLAAEEGTPRELFELRRILECEAAALAAVRRSDEHVALLEASNHEMSQELTSDSRYITADINFHVAIADATGNRMILHLMHAIREQLRTVLGTVFNVPGGPERSVEQHRQIAAAITLQQPDRARDLMNEHITRVERELYEAAGAGD